MEPLDTSIGRTEGQFGKWGTKLDGLLRSAEAKLGYRKRLGELVAARQAAEATLNGYRTTGVAKLTTLRSGLGREWRKVDEAIRRALR